MSSSTLSANWFWPLFPVAFVGLWIVVGFFISLAGWSSFAIRYPARTRPAGTVYNSRVTRFGSFQARYRNVVRVIFTEKGIYFYVHFLFRAFHTPFLVPWESVAHVEKTRCLFWSCYRIYIVDSAGEIEALLPLKIETDLSRFRKDLPIN